MSQDFTVKKKAIFVWKKKFVQKGSPGKKIRAQAVSEKKNSCKLKIPHLPLPHHFSNGPSLNLEARKWRFQHSPRDISFEKLNLDKV